MGVEYMLVRCDYNPVVAFDLGKCWFKFEPDFIEDPVLLLEHLQDLSKEYFQFDRNYLLLLRDRILDFADGSKQIELQNDSCEGEWINAIETHDRYADDAEISSYSAFTAKMPENYAKEPLSVFRSAVQAGIARKKKSNI